MGKKKANRSSKQEVQIEKGANFNDVLIKLIDAIYNLLNSGNIIGIILVFFFTQVMFLSYKLSPEMLDKHLSGIFGFLKNDGLYLFPLLIALIVSLAANFIQRKTYKSHIHNMAEFRKVIIHGIDNKDLKTLDHHNSSGIDIRKDKE